jgi:hypothetical protein
LALSNCEDGGKLKVAVNNVTFLLNLVQANSQFH